MHCGAKKITDVSKVSMCTFEIYIYYIWNIYYFQLNVTVNFAPTLSRCRKIDILRAKLSISRVYLWKKKNSRAGGRERFAKFTFVHVLLLISWVDIFRVLIVHYKTSGADRIYHPCSRIGRALVCARHSRQILCVKINWIAAKNTLNKVQFYVTMTQSMLREIVLVLMRNLCVNKKLNFFI